MMTLTAASLAYPPPPFAMLNQPYLRRRTNFVIHCAASIRFEEPISVIMRTNFASTEQLLRLASDMPYLRCFTYMSTAYVNSNLPRHSQVREEIYPLPGTSDPLAVARTLLDLPAAEADRMVTPSPCPLLPLTSHFSLLT